MLRTNGKRSLLAVALRRARREHGAPDRGRLPHRAAAARRRRLPRGMALDARKAPAARTAILPSTASSRRATSSTTCCSTATNPSSVASCLAAARRNAPRAAHRADARNVGEPQQRLDRVLSHQAAIVTSDELPELLDWVRSRSALYRGALLNTILRNDTFYFSQLGTFLERADNTARILDVKYYVLLPSSEMVGGGSRQRAVGVDPALGLGAPQLPLGLQGDLPALAHRRVPDPQPADAALAARLLRRD